ncbi:atypical membrane-integrating protein (Mistic protein) [Bacillus sp. Marseille-P3661]|uniref:atypical membrane-integrating protein (Mistic protein) n=1 Tax=Bacillus sp. Marseille-P3661 TaxID=1936234 RepID=UPI000C83AD44|nr:atypical membrane-integrating protein (Mistic protein) [Bacillus sp. Marseille-P3661]
MRVTSDENKKLSDAIDQMQEGLDTFIELYNQSEEDKPFLGLDDEVMDMIQTATKVLGADVVNQKVNTIIKEVLSLLPLDDYRNEHTDDEDTE